MLFPFTLAITVEITLCIFNIENISLLLLFYSSILFCSSYPVLYVSGFKNTYAVSSFHSVM